MSSLRAPPDGSLPTNVEGMIDAEFINRSLALLRGRDPESSLFGAIGRRYRLNPTLAESHVQAFERHHGIHLPDDYRCFITTAGNGGAGPYCGVFRLGEHDHLRDFCTWEAGGLGGHTFRTLSVRERLKFV